MFFFTLSVLFIVSCVNREDSVIQSDVPALKGQNKEGIDLFQQIQNNDDFKSLVDNFKLNDYFGRADEAKKRSEKESSEFKVFIETVSEVRLKTYVSYKFLIDRGGKRKGLFEYLILVNNNGKEAAWIIAQNPDNQWLEDRYIKGKETPFKGGISIESVSQEENLLKSRVNSCTELYYYIDVRCPCANHTVDDYCTCGRGLPERTWFKSIDCSGGGGGWFFPVVVPNPPSEPIPNNVLVASDGTTPSPSVLAASLGLNSSEQTWLANSMDISNWILLYYHDSGQSSESANFSNWAIDYMMANGTSAVQMIQASLQLLNEDSNLNELSVMDAILNWVSYRNGMPSSEQSIFDGMSLLNQTRYLVSARQAKRHAEILYPANTQINGLGDAFRHAYWNALCVKRIGMSLTISLTTAHEDHYDTVNYTYYQKDKDMDLFNNDVGRGLGMHLYGELPDKVQQAVSWGHLRYLSPLGAYISGNWINTAANASSILKPTNE